MTVKPLRQNLVDSPSHGDTVLEDQTARLRPAIEELPLESPRRRRRWYLPFAFLGIAAAGLAWWLNSQHYETTDDAQIEGHLDEVSARISGTVSYINPRVENDRFVEAGTLLLELDPRDYEADLERAKADFDAKIADAHSAEVTVPIVNASAFSQLRTAEAEWAEALAAVRAAQAELAVAQHRLQQDEAIQARAERDRVRYQALVEKREISRSEYDARQTEANAMAQAVQADRAGIQSKEQKVDEARSLVAQREAQVAGANTAPEQVTNARARSRSAAGHLQQAKAELHTAQLNLSYTKIYAPAGGVIGRKTVELGHRVQPGQGLLMIVPLDDIWITANFKETQLKRMRPGQPVRVHVDSFDRDYTGTVENLPGAAGPLFSLFPPENATGNYVKVVQRFPVRIRFDKGQDPQRRLRPGMSVEPAVRVH